MNGGQVPTTCFLGGGRIATTCALGMACAMALSCEGSTMPALGSPTDGSADSHGEMDGGPICIGLSLAKAIDVAQLGLSSETTEASIAKLVPTGDPTVVAVKGGNPQPAADGSDQIAYRFLSPWGDWNASDLLVPAGTLSYRSYGPSTAGFGTAFETLGD